MNRDNLSQTPLGRAVLHVACLWRNPAAARFFLAGLTRNLREWCHRQVPRRSNRRTHVV
jgi:hypothetical protein